MNKKILFIGLLITASLSAQQTLANGALSTGATSNSGMTAASGYTWSEVQHNTGNTTQSNTNAGYASAYVSSSNSYFLADDFVVPAGSQWTISSIDVFSYQSGYSNTSTSPFNTIRLSIYNTDPSVAGATPVFGDDTTNRFSSSTNAMMHRIFNSTVPSTVNPPGTTRIIWKTNATVGTTLQPGTYWVKFQLQNSSTTANYVPSVTVPGSRGLATFNGKQYNAISSVWTNLVDEGDPTTAPDYPQDVPFVVNYTATVLGVQENLQYDNRINIYPNPVKDAFRISNIETLKLKSIEILDASGKVLRNFKPNTEYNIQDLPKGNYLIKIHSNEVTKIVKLIKA